MNKQEEVEFQAFAEKFAVGFTEWIRENCYDIGDRWLYQHDDEAYTTEELLEKYKAINKLC